MMGKSLMRAALVAGVAWFALLGSARPAEAEFLGRHTLLGQIFRMTPPGRALATFEDRRDAYQGAQAWLDAQKAEAERRNSELREGLRSGQVDLRSYIRAREQNERRMAQYEQVKDRMTRIGRDNFNRALAQQFLERLGPRIGRSATLNRRMDEIRGTLQAGQQLLEEGTLRLDELASRVYPNALRDGRERIRDLLDRFDRSGLGGRPVEEIRRTLQGLERGLGALEQRVTEAVKPEEVKQLQSEAQNMAQTLAGLQERLDEGIRRLNDRNTVYFPPRSVATDRFVREHLEQFAQDVGMLERAMAETEIRRTLGTRLEAACAQVAVATTDPAYVQIRQRALNLLSPEQAAGIGDAELAAVCAEARDQIVGVEEGARKLGTAFFSGDLSNLTGAYLMPVYSLWFGWWEYDTGIAQWLTSYCAVFPIVPAPAALSLEITIHLDTGEITGSWSGAAEGQVAGVSAPDTVREASGTFSGGVNEGSAILDVDDDGQGFRFQADAWMNVALSGRVHCEQTGQSKTVSQTISLPATVRGDWRSGAGRVIIEAGGEGIGASFGLTVVDPPFEITP